MRKTFWVIKSVLTSLLLIVLIGIGVRFYLITMPKMELEADEANNLSLIAIQSAAQSRILLTHLNSSVPVTEAKVDTALGSANTTLLSINQMVKHLDKNQDSISLETVNALKALEMGITVTANSIGNIGDQTVTTEQSIADTADATTDTAKSLTRAGNAVTDTVSDPAIHQTIANTRDALGNVKDATGDAKDWLHKWLHPKWPTTVYNEIKSWGAHIAAAFL
jgi:hypothetical protein